MGKMEVVGIQERSAGEGKVKELMRMKGCVFSGKFVHIFVIF